MTIFASMLVTFMKEQIFRGPYFTILPLTVFEKRYIIIKANFFLFFFFWERERAQVNKGQRERERTRILWGTEGREREVGITHTKARAYPKQGSNSPEAGLKLMNCEIMTWAKVRCLTDWPTQVSLKASFVEVLFTSVWCLSSGMEIESGKLTQNGHPIK